MIDLSNIELVALTSVRVDDFVKALIYSSKEIKFGAIKLFCHYKPDNLPSNIEYINTPELSYYGYNKFSIEELGKYITHDYMLIINDDGFVINPHLWDNNFLKYDYIGAPWPADAGFLYDMNRPGNRVGNGGFCLKSYKLMKLCTNIKYFGGNDDVIITNDYTQYFTANGCKFAPVEIAMKFSLEMEISECEYNLDNTFGFHGKASEQHFNKIKLLEQIIL